MKKIVGGLTLAFALAAATPSLAADTVKASDPVTQLTGKVWQESKPENKRAVLFGIDTAVAIENAINEKQQAMTRKKARAPHTLSVFEKSWMEAFKNKSRDEIVEQVDQWYAANPGQLERPVMDVIWYEIIVPATKPAK